MRPHIGGAFRRITAVTGIALTTVFLAGLTASAGDATPGATVDELLVMARQLNPELAARALESEAALAVASAADALDDPMFRITSDEVDRTGGNRINKMIYSVEQEFPLWGKRQLRREIAQAEAAGVRSQQQLAAIELDARIKTVFAQYWRATREVEVTHDVHALLHSVAQSAQSRYAQGIGLQSDAIRSALERSRLDLALAAIERDKRIAHGQLNALLARPPGAPLAEPVALSPLPSASVLSIDSLLDRARQNNPMLASAAYEITAAEASRRLVEKNRYPDISLGVGAIDREDGPAGVMASAGIRVPLQWGLRKAQISEATKLAGAAQSRRDAALLQLQGGLEEALAGLQAARQTETLLTTSLQPQAQAAYRSALSGYQVARSDLTAVLEAAHRTQEIRLELLKAQAEQQALLADIELIIGGSL
ncbi:MAG: TolC family protein [Pseudomonadota bacterium]